MLLWFFIRPHRCTECKVRPVSTDVTWSASVSVCVSVEHNYELCQNGWTNRDAVWGVDLGEPKKPRVMGAPTPTGEDTIWGRPCDAAWVEILWPLVIRPTIINYMKTNVAGTLYKVIKVRGRSHIRCALCAALVKATLLPVQRSIAQQRAAQRIMWTAL